MAGETNIGARLAGLMVYGEKATGLVLAGGVHITKSESDQINTGLSKIFFAWSNLESDPTPNVIHTKISIGDQCGNPPGGCVLINTYNTGASVATQFSKKVQWIVLGNL